MTKKKPVAKRKTPKKDVTVTSKKEEINFHLTPYGTYDEQLRERLVNLAANTTTQENVGKVGHSPASTKQILDRAEQFYQFVKKK